MIGDCVCVVPSTPKSYVPASSTVTTHTQANAAAAARSALISYDFISDPAKKAFFESSSARRQQAMCDRSDVDINDEAKINQYVAIAGDR